MFDAKSILEGLVRGAGPSSSNSGNNAGSADAGGLGNILQELQRQLGGAASQGQTPGSAGSDGGLGGGLGDIFANIQEQLGKAGGAAQSAPGHSGQSGGGLGGGLGDILGQFKDQMSGNSGAAGGAGAASGGGGLMDVLGQILGQATDGVREGAGKISDATGAGDALNQATGGRTPEDLLGQLRDFIQNNPIAAGTAATGLGGLVLGTQTGRRVAGAAARMGALALIGGLAYKALQNYQAGRPLIHTAEPAAEAPTGSGFEVTAVTNDQAVHYIQAMIAAAASDGRIDADEQTKVIASLRQVGLDQEAEEFLANELNNPASAAQLAGLVSSPEEGVQLYTAARIAIEPDTSSEQRFLAELAGALGLNADLKAHIDATTRGAGA